MQEYCKCPESHTPFRNEPNWCAACGYPIKEEPPVPQELDDKRMFVVKEQGYGMRMVMFENRDKINEILAYLKASEEIKDISQLLPKEIETHGRLSNGYGQYVLCECKECKKAYIYNQCLSDVKRLLGVK